MSHATCAIGVLSRHTSRYASPEPTTREEDRLAQQNENLVHYIESWLTVAKQLIKLHEQMMLSNDHHRPPTMIDEERTCSASSVSLENEMTDDNLLDQLKVCFD